MKVCPKCGRTSDEIEFVDNFCIECYQPDIKVPTKIIITVGKVTGKLYFKGKWIKNTEDNVKKIISSHIKGEFEDIDYDPKLRVLTVFVKVKDKVIPYKRHVVIRYKYSLEPEEAKLRSGYYEGIIQVRGKPGKVRWWVKRLMTLLSRARVGVSNVKELKEGVDLYITDKKKVPEVLRSAGLKFKTSRTLYGLKEGKRVYRETFLVRVTPKKR